MVDTHATVWIKSDAQTSGGCGQCVPTERGAACRTQLAGEVCPEPTLTGDADLLKVALQALDGVIDADCGRSLIDLRFLRSLHVDGDEAVLTVSFPLHCGPSREMADNAFQALRSVLHDTDIYVQHSG